MIFTTFATAAYGSDLPDYANVLPMPTDDIPLTTTSEQRKAVFAGGCFWCTEVVFKELAGVSRVVPGYSGGTKETANYDAVSSGGTKHAEAIEITYDASKITYGRLLRVFMTMHDPTTLNRQGPDVGPHYRSAIFYASPDEKRVAEGYIKQVDASKHYPNPVVTTLEPLTAFYVAEQYHHNYAELNPMSGYIRQQATPKIGKVRAKFKDEVKPATTQPGR